MIDMRGEARLDIDQRYLTVDGILNRLDALADLGIMNDKRVLLIGDADLTGIALSIFGNPKEVVVADIDERMSEIYFEAMLDFDAAIRYLYHDMRIKIIAILRNQYSLVMFEPPRTIGAVEVFLSRAVEIIEIGESNFIVINLPSSGIIRDHFNSILPQMGLTIERTYPGINLYEDGSEPSDLIALRATESSVPLSKDHHIRPFYEGEVTLVTKPYRCICRVTIEVGPGQQFETIEQLEASGCPSCQYNGVFAFRSKIQLK
jgi:predicted methyltransferase